MATLSHLGMKELGYDTLSHVDTGGLHCTGLNCHFLLQLFYSKVVKLDVCHVGIALKMTIYLYCVNIKRDKHTFHVK